MIYRRTKIRNRATGGFHGRLEVNIKNDHDRGSLDESGFVAGMLVGSVLGAMAAIFLAPKSGRALRKDIVSG